MFHILIVDDDKTVRYVMKEIVESAGYIAFPAKSGEEAFEILAREHIDLAIVDIMMPKQNGYELTREIRSYNQDFPILMVSAKHLPEDRKQGFLAGIDDYMSKPFSVLELIARVKTNLRRANLYVTNQNGIVVDNNVYKIFCDGKDLGLTLKEFKLLKLLVSKAGTTVLREDLFREVWGEGFMGETRTLDMHIAQIREKIKTSGGGEMIVTVRGVGYRFEKQ